MSRSRCRRKAVAWHGRAVVARRLHGTVADLWQGNRTDLSHTHCGNRSHATVTLHHCHMVPCCATGALMSHEVRRVPCSPRSASVAWNDHAIVARRLPDSRITFRRAPLHGSPFLGQTHQVRLLSSRTEMIIAGLFINSKGNTRETHNTESHKMIIPALVWAA